MSVRQDREGVVIITKACDLNLGSCNHTGRFPHNSRFVLGERIERCLYDWLEILIRAKYTRNRQEFLEQANLLLEIRRFQVRLAKDLQCLKVASYGFAAKRTDEKASGAVKSAKPTAQKPDPEHHPAGNEPRA
jgi:hypothetical protein